MGCVKTLSAEQKRVLDAVTEQARPILLEEFRADSCIASTKVGLDVLAYFGMRGEPLAVSAMLFNAEAMTMLNEGTSMEDLHAVMKAIPADQPGGPWSLGLGVGSSQPGTWAGHLVVALPQYRTIVDLSADQASRPHKGLTVETFHAVIDNTEWWSGEDPIVTFGTSEGATFVLDRRSPDPEGFRSAPNWQAKGSSSPALYKALTGRIIRAVKAAL
jgi:hypothetical protein